MVGAGRYHMKGASTTVLSRLLNNTTEAECCHFGKSSVTPAATEQSGGGRDGKG